jgi:hypothetical protein
MKNLKFFIFETIEKSPSNKFLNFFSDWTNIPNGKFLFRTRNFKNSFTRCNKKSVNKVKTSPFL